MVEITVEGNVHYGENVDTGDNHEMHVDDENDEVNANNGENPKENEEVNRKDGFKLGEQDSDQYLSDCEAYINAFGSFVDSFDDELYDTTASRLSTHINLNEVTKMSFWQIKFELCKFIGI